MEEVTLEQFGWLYEYHYEQKKEEYEVLAHVVSVGYARTQTKKKIKLFDEKQQKTAVNNITAKEKAEKLSKLKELFG